MQANGNTCSIETVFINNNMRLHHLFQSISCHDAVVHFIGYWVPIGVTSFTVLVSFWRIPMYLTYGDNYLRLLFITNYKVMFEWFAMLTVCYIIVVLLQNINLSLKRQSTSLFDRQFTSS